MRKKVSLLVLLVTIAMLSVACSQTPTATGVAKNQDHSSLSATLDQEKQLEIAEIGSIFNTRVETSGNVLSSAQENEACEKYYSTLAFEQLYERAQRVGANDLMTQIKTTLTKEGRAASAAGYVLMKSGKPLGCGGREVSEAFMIEQFAKIMDKYPTNGAGTIDPKVIRTAYLQAIKPDIQDAILEATLRPDSADAQGALVGMIQDAEQKWHFTPAELGVSLAMQQKLKM